MQSPQALGLKVCILLLHRFLLPTSKVDGVAAVHYGRCRCRCCDPMSAFEHLYWSSVVCEYLMMGAHLFEMYSFYVHLSFAVGDDNDLISTSVYDMHIHIVCRFVVSLVWSVSLRGWSFKSLLLPAVRVHSDEAKVSSFPIAKWGI